MTLRAKGLGLIAAVFSVVLGASFLLFERMTGEITSSLGTLYAQEQVLSNRARILHPVMRELEDFRRSFADGSFFFGARGSGHYSFNDRENRCATRSTRRSTRTAGSSARSRAASPRRSTSISTRSSA